MATSHSDASATVPVSLQSQPQQASAILSFPDELLVEIAAAAVQEERSPADEFRAELALSHLSHRFRDIMIGAPTLWTVIKTKPLVDGSVELLKLYLERSRACKIWVTLHEPGATYYPHQLIAADLSHILPHVNRIWRLRIECGSQNSMSAVLAVFRNVAAPALEHLEISHCGRWIDNLTMDIFSSGAPMLTSFKLNCGAKFPVLPWTAHLTHLNLCSGDFWTSNMVILRQCLSLVHLSLNLTPIMHPVNIPSLESLTIMLPNSHNNRNDHLRETFTHWDMPALSNLVIQCTHGNQTWVLLNSTRNLHLSFPALTSLSFVSYAPCDCADDEDDDRVFPPTFQSISSSSLLQLSPILSSLTLINQCFTINILSEVLGRNSQPWPLLKTVSIHPQSRKSRDVYRTLQQVVRSRRLHHLALPLLRLSRPLFSEKYWEENGVNVELFGPTEFLDAFD
ncbi:hypothetical protein DFH07DRAFT_377259 [Mycena maculata]|uniref:F-box domain-containing protein n=1 Tax=Mycena maculata TaxID=230809 RepID=A0AAD7JGV1_9AGAR|nr:hypothetical protein DFH07DRAFT_377259 [Mycena maculata]